jgi:hypothetical protein
VLAISKSHLTSPLFFLVFALLVQNDEYLRFVQFINFVVVVSVIFEGMSLISKKVSLLLLMDFIY